jgi:hypothetical protein
MAKGGDLIGKSGGAGFGPMPKPKPTIPIIEEDKTKDPKHPDFKPPKDQKPAKGGGGHAGIGGTPSSVRPKV